MNKITLGFFRTRSTATIKTVFVLFAVLLMNTQTSWGQISITGTGIGNTYSQDFSGLASASNTTSTVVPAGWAFLETGTGTDGLYLVNSGASSTGNTFSYGTIGSADRALGGLQSGSLIPAIGVSFKNDSAETITQLVIAYTGEQWRLGALGRVDRLDFQYSLNATSLNTGTWTDVNSLDFTAPVTTGTVGAIDGNATGNKTSISGAISGLSIAPGATFWLRFNDSNPSGADDGLAVDDFSLYGTVPVITNYYYDGSGSLATLSNWGTSTNGSGTNPLDFGSATSDQVFVITNTAAVATDATWAIGGNNKVVVGDVTQPAVTLTISSGSPITLGTGALDIAAASSGNNEVIFGDASLPTLGVIDVSANITYANGGAAIAITTIPCNTLKISSSTNVSLISTNSPFCKFLVVDSGSSITAGTGNVITLASGGSATINGTFAGPRTAGLFTTGAVAAADRGHIHNIDATATITLGANSKIIFSRFSSAQIIAPLVYADLEIAGPGVVLTTDITVNKDLTLASTATVTVSAGKNLLVGNGIKNLAAGPSPATNLTLENNANLIQTAVLNTNTGAFGNTAVKRNSNPLFRLDYTMWSSPVSGQNLLNFSPATLATRFYTYDNTLGTTGLYKVVADPSTTPFDAGTGYLIRMPDTDPATDYNAGTGVLAYPGVFTGIINNGDINLTVASGTFNAVGNPYPSTIVADEFITDNAIAEALYFWRKTNNVNQTTAPTTSYATYTLAGGAGTGPGSSSITPNGFIQVGQGFIAKSTSTTLKFTNSMRTANNAGQILKTKVVERNRIWLNLTSPVGGFNQMMLAYMTGATQGIDAAIDGRYFNDSPTALNSLVNNEEFAIQGRSLPFDGTDTVPLAFKTDVAGDFTIAIDHVDGLFSGNQDIYLVDSKTGTETNLKTSSYTFTAAAAVDNIRFSLKYQKTLSLDAQELNDNSVIVYKNGGVIYVNSGAKTINNIKVFDILGRVVAERNNVKANTSSFQNLRASNQVLIVKVTTDDNQVISKKVEN